MRRHFVISVSCFVFYKEIANFNTTKIKAVNERSCLSYIHSPTRGFDIRYGVGVDCLSVVRRLAMPLVR